jgi:hypothetical protein
MAISCQIIRSEAGRRLWRDLEDAACTASFFGRGVDIAASVEYYAAMRHASGSAVEAGEACYRQQQRFSIGPQRNNNSEGAMR